MMRLTKFNPETGLYEYVKKAKTLDEYRAQRKAAIQKLGEFEDKASDLAEEIFAEIDTLIVRRMIADSPFIDDRLIRDITKLRKKYIGKYTNVTTNTEDGK